MEFQVQSVYLIYTRLLVHATLTLCHMQVHLSRKLHPHGDVTSKKYKPTFLATCLMAVLQPSVSRLLMVDFILFSLFILFYFTLLFLFIFYFQNNSGQELSVTLSHQSQLDGVVTRLITGLRRMKQKELEQSDVIQHGHHMLASCITHGHLGQGAQQLARTMRISI